MSRTQTLWLIWILGSLAVAAILVTRLYVAGDRSLFLIGETTGVHHQLEVSCETCHAAGPFASAKKTNKALNKACLGCHKEELAVSDDSHPIKKFTNPRMASLWDKVDARYCTSCHLEHQPEITHPGAVTLAMDYCVACHSEGDRDVRKNRPSHAGLEYDTCATAGCHNYHDNRALYEDFLVKHADEPWLRAPRVLTAVALASASRPAATEDEVSRYTAAISAPDSARKPDLLNGWAASPHAATEVGCESCHAPGAETPEAVDAAWIAKPDAEACESCHREATGTFRLGRHGMRQHPKIAKPRKPATGMKALGLDANNDDSVFAVVADWLNDPAPPEVMTVREARVPLSPLAHGRDVTCMSCHDPHAPDRQEATVDACMSCHDDEHTSAYPGSPHHQLWVREIAGAGAPGSGVACATCHMPAIEAGGQIATNHNQNDVLRPNEKMIRPVCMNCHGLGFALDALADPDLVSRNFKGSPAGHVESIDWAVRRVKTTDSSANQ